MNGFVLYELVNTKMRDAFDLTSVGSVFLKRLLTGILTPRILRFLIVYTVLEPRGFRFLNTIGESLA